LLQAFLPKFLGPLAAELLIG